MILTVAGLWNSGPQHWQSVWEAAHPAWKRVPHRDWDTPAREEWVDEFEAAVAACPEPPVLVAHSLGCVLVAHWASLARHSPIRGAFLVAPSDVAAASYPRGPTDFSPIPLTPLPFPSLLVTSTDDHYVTLERATAFAAAWHSELVVAGKAGHFNGASGHGPWPEGLARLEGFLARIP